MVLGSTVERRLFGKLAATSESAALRGIFFGATAAKKNPFGEPKAAPGRLAVIGAGPHALSLLCRCIDDEPDLLTEEQRVHVATKAGRRGRTWAEVQKHLRKRFDAIDRDGSGYIDIDEYVLAMEQEILREKIAAEKGIDFILPKDVRNDFYVNIYSGKLSRLSKTAYRNVEVVVEAMDEARYF